jgi:metal-responsive CopG/Arc/MetJ family transcriptional regulator
MTTTQVALRIPDELLVRVDRLVGKAHASRSDAIRRAIELYLYRIECERDARAYDRQPLTEGELAMADDPDGWKDAPAW